MHKLTVLKSKKSISALFSAGKTYADKNLRIKILFNASDTIRIVFTIPKKSGHRPSRNTQIRRIRVIARALTHNTLNIGCDMAVIAQNATADFNELRTSYIHLLSRVKQSHA